ncbi:hypothetical protein ACQ4PT_061093 [Festuca glaucescens]
MWMEAARSRRCGSGRRGPGDADRGGEVQEMWTVAAQRKWGFFQGEREQALRDFSSGSNKRTSEGGGRAGQSQTNLPCSTCFTSGDGDAASRSGHRIFPPSQIEEKISDGLVLFFVKFRYRYSSAFIDLTRNLSACYFEGFFSSTGIGDCSATTHDISLIFCEGTTRCSNPGAAMAEHLASIFGTEKDRVNCPFYFKIGACRHGDRCSRLHNRPSVSPTLLLCNMYQRPDMITPGFDPQGNPIDPSKIQGDFEDFYEDIFDELSKYGEVENLHVCDNLADHLIGNVYVSFREEDQAAKALQALQGRFYSGRPIIAEFSPVTDFREATCRQFEEHNCNRGGYCNFMHVKEIGRDLRKRLYGHLHRSRRSHSRSSRSPSPYHYHSRDRDRSSWSSRDRGDYYGGSLDRGDYGDYHHHSRRSSERNRNYDSDGSRRRRHRSRSRSPVREGSEERRAKIEQWNREREAAQA